MKRYLSVIALAIVSMLSVVFVIWYASWKMIVEYPGFQNWAERGSFGDMFGAVSSLFSGFAFCGLIITIILQVRQLAIQHRELEQARADISEQQRYLEAQSKVVEQQRFETTFFQLLRFHHDTVGTLAVGDYTGRVCFRVIYEEFAENLKDTDMEDSDELAKIQLSFDKVYGKIDYGLDQYFRSLYSVVRFTDQNKAIYNKEFYIEFVKAQLSSYELLMLFYYCLTDQGKVKLKPLVVTYVLLANLPKDQIIEADHLRLLGRR